MVKLLKRQSAMTPAMPDEIYSFDLLMDEAKTHLGYSVSLFDLAPKKVWPREKSSKPLTLYEALANLGISPFTMETVEKYKCKKVQNLRVRAFLRIFGRHFVWVFLAIFLGFLVPAVLEILFNGQQIQAPFNWLLGLSVIPLCACLMARWLCREMPNGFLWIGWNIIPIEYYKKPIPEFALYSAVELKKLCPKAQFFVEELYVDDPFLVVNYGGNLYWIEVWNEPDFNQKRKI